MSKPITEDWLASVGFQSGDIFMTLLLPPVDERAAITEVAICPSEDGESWDVSLWQGMPDEPNGRDDHVAITSKVFRTRADVWMLCSALGKQLDPE